MNKPRSGASGTWTCPYSCDQAAHIKKHKRYCVHLERLLGPIESEDTRREILTDDVSKFEKGRVDLYDGDEHTDEEKLRNKLAPLLAAKAAEVVIDRTVKGKTFKEIAIDRGYSEAAAAGRAYRDALAVLKKRNFGGVK